MPRSRTLTAARTAAIVRDLRAGKTLGQAAKANGASRAGACDATVNKLDSPLFVRATATRIR